jgi:hypothetical protein
VDSPAQTLNERKVDKLRGIRLFFRIVTVCTLIVSFFAPPSVSAQGHVVSPVELRAAVSGAMQQRQRNLESVEALLSTPEAKKALRTTQVDLKLVKTAVASLSDDELARLAARSEQAQAELAAGRLSDRDLLWILVGIAALILIIVAVD